MELNLETTCRICLDASANHNIFSTTCSDGRVSCYEVINSVFAMSATEGDGLPPKICYKCHSKIAAIFKFRYLAQRSLKKLLRHFDRLDKKEEIDTVLKLEDIKEEIIDNDNIVIDGTTLLDFDPCIDTKVTTISFNDCSVMLEKNEINDYDLPEHPDFQLDDFDDYDDDDCKPLILAVSTAVKNENDYQAPKSKSQKNNNTNGVNVKQKMKRIEKSASVPTFRHQGPTICPVCGKTVANLKDHMKIHDANRKKLPCADCSKTFLTYGSRAKHIKRVHLNIRYFCKICQKRYVAGADHFRQMHSNKEKKFACMQCDKKYFLKGQLDVHMTIHTKERPFKCEHCGKTFRSQSLCNQHVRKDHDMERSHICQYCSKGFFRIDRLNTHLISHTKEKRYKCKICDKMFATRSTVRGHELKHSGIKNYKCQVCQNSFFTPGALTIHMISHTKEKKHACKYCGIKFGRTDHRNRHQQTAHEMKTLGT